MIEMLYVCHLEEQSNLHSKAHGSGLKSWKLRIQERKLIILVTAPAQ